MKFLEILKIVSSSEIILFEIERYFFLHSFDDFRYGFVAVVSKVVRFVRKIMHYQI